MSGNLKKTLYLGLALRLALGSFLYHPDIKSHYFHAQFLSQGYINIYEYLDSHRRNLPYSDTFNYPPLVYALQGTWYPIAGILAGQGLQVWLWDWGENAYFHPQVLANLLVLKFPYFFFDLLSLYFLLSLTKKSPLTAALWLFNPISLYAVYAVGQYDIIPVFFTILALVFLKTSRYPLSGFALGVGAALKTYPALFLPFVLFRVGDKKIALMTIFCFATSFITPQLAFLESIPFRQIVFNSSLSARLFEYKFLNIPIFLLVYSLLLFVSWFRGKNQDIYWEFLAVSLSIIAVIRFHAQWTLWAIPFLTFAVSQKPRLIVPALLWMTFVLAWFMLLPDKFVLAGLFSLLQPAFLTIPPLSEVLPALQPVMRGLLVISSFWLVIQSYKYAQPK